MLTLLFLYSGTHTNPVVSLAIWLIGKMEHIMVIPYIIAQLCGGILGAALTKVHMPEGGSLELKDCAPTLPELTLPCAMSAQPQVCAEVGKGHYSTSSQCN